MKISRDTVWREKATFLAPVGPFEVTQAMISAYEDSGFVLIRNLFSAEEIGHIRAAIDNPEGVLKHTYSRSDGANREAKLCLWLHPGSDVTGVAVRINKVAGTMEKLMGGQEIYHYHTKVIRKEARTGGAFVWHQDYGYWYYNGCLFPDMGTVFMPVDDCFKVNGCLSIVPGSHKMGRLDHETVGEQLQADGKRLEKILEKFPSCYVEMSPGDVLFFHCNLLHASTQNSSDKRRYVLISTYNKKNNDSYKVHHHPQYTPLQKLPDEALLECTNVRGLEGKDFQRGEDEKSHLGAKQDQ